jgi:hypothetical protein
MFANGSRVGSRRGSGFELMPTFPQSSLSFRTAGFPQYSWKTGFPSGAFLGRRPTSGLHPPFVRLVVTTVVPHCVGPQTRLRTAVEDHYSFAPGLSLPNTPSCPFDSRSRLTTAPAPARWRSPNMHLSIADTPRRRPEAGKSLPSRAPRDLAPPAAWPRWGARHDSSAPCCTGARISPASSGRRHIPVDGNVAF